MLLVRTFKKVGEGGPCYLLFSNFVFVFFKMATMSKMAAIT